jgi:hypothetical protein
MWGRQSVVPSAGGSKLIFLGGTADSKNHIIPFSGSGDDAPIILKLRIHNLQVVSVLCI